MPHIWLREEEREGEARTPLTPEGVRALKDAGFEVTVEDAPARIIPTPEFAAAGARIAPPGSWREAPREAFILGLKELVADQGPLAHRHIMFGHAYKGQPDGPALLARFRRGGGRLLDLEYLTDEAGRRVAAFGFFAGYAGAIVSLAAWAAQREGKSLGPIALSDGVAPLKSRIAKAGATPSALVIGALGRVGRGAAEACREFGIEPTLWDKDETAHGGPFPEVLEHELFFNCILAGPGTPVFVPEDAGGRPRALRVIGDIACDPGTDYSPVRVYDRVTAWDAPVLRVHDAPPLEVMAIDNLPSLVPLEASREFAADLLPHLLTLDAPESGVWGRADALFEQHVNAG